MIHIRAATTAINTLLRVGSRLTVCQEVSQVLVTICRHTVKPSSSILERIVVVGTTLAVSIQSQVFDAVQQLIYITFVQVSNLNLQVGQAVECKERYIYRTVMIRQVIGKIQQRSFGHIQVSYTASSSILLHTVRNIQQDGHVIICSRSDNGSAAAFITHQNIFIAAAGESIFIIGADFANRIVFTVDGNGQMSGAAVAIAVFYRISEGISQFLTVIQGFHSCIVSIQRIAVSAIAIQGQLTVLAAAVCSGNSYRSIRTSLIVGQYIAAY